MHFQTMYIKCPISIPGCACAEQLHHTNSYEVLARFSCSEHMVNFQGITGTCLKTLGLQNSVPFVVKVSFSKSNSSGDLLK